VEGAESKKSASLLTDGPLGVNTGSTINTLCAHRAEKGGGRKVKNVRH
jgi:hypothetical protein